MLPKLPSPNFTKFPNIILDVWLPQIDASLFKIVAYLVRETYGWRKPTAKLTYQEIAEGTNLCKRTVATHVQEGLKIGALEREPVPGTQDFIYFLPLESNPTPPPSKQDYKECTPPHAEFSDTPTPRAKNAPTPRAKNAQAPSSPYTYNISLKESIAVKKEGEAPLSPPPAACSASDEFKKTVELPIKHPADRTNDENIAILKADLGKVFNESQMGRAIDFFLRMTWKELSQDPLNLTGYVRSAIEGDWDVERGSRAFRPHKDSQAASLEREHNANKSPERFWDKQNLTVCLEPDEIPPALSRLAERLFAKECLRGTKIEATPECLLFSWTMGEVDISYELPCGEFYSQAKKMLGKWNLDATLLESAFIDSYCENRKCAEASTP